MVYLNRPPLLALFPVPTSASCLRWCRCTRIIRTALSIALWSFTPTLTIWAVATTRKAKRTATLAHISLADLSPVSRSKSSPSKSMSSSNIARNTTPTLARFRRRIRWRDGRIGLLPTLLRPTWMSKASPSPPCPTTASNWRQPSPLAKVTQFFDEMTLWF